MGFALRTLGADETVARQIGINTVVLKVGTFVVSSVVMALAGAILAPRNSYVTAQIVFTPEVSFLTVIAALLGGAGSVWGPMLGVVPLLLLKDYLTIAYPNYFSVLLGLILLGVVFFIPNGILGLLQRGRAALGSARHSGAEHGPKAAPAASGLADLLEALARRLRGVRPDTAALQVPASHPAANGLDRAAAHAEVPGDTPERKIAR
jgi:branched-chain amino acid transport system permease protein